MEPCLAEDRKREAVVFRVGELTRVIKGLIEQGFPLLWVEGEVSGLKDHRASGHVFFTLREGGASLKAVLFRPYRRGLPFRLEDGLQVLCFGRLSVYEARGEYQLLVQRVEPCGQGALHLALEQLKRRLAAEGLFAAERKRPLPLWPRVVGVVTSLEGAALRDFLRVGFERHPRAAVVVFPVRVQGAGAEEEIAEGVRVLGRHPGVEVVVVTRGGGAAEDLMAYNTEAVARAVFHCPVPVVSAVGHEVDHTICDLVADLRVPTPTAAAQAVFPEAEALAARLRELTGRLERGLRQRLGDHRRELEGLVARLRSPERRVREARARHRELVLRLGRLIEAHLGRKRERLAATVRQLQALSPLSVLARGYSIVRCPPGGRIVRRAEEARPGDLVEVVLHEGRLLARVEEVRK